VKGEIFCEGETFGGEIALLFVALFIIFNSLLLMNILVALGLLNERLI